MEFVEKRLQKRAEVTAEMREAENELNALLREAGINDGLPDRYSLDVLDKEEDEADYRQRVRELVFKVDDVDLRKKIIRRIQHLFHTVPKDAQGTFHLFDDMFVADLRDKRCQPPRLTSSPLVVAAIPLAVACLAISDWFGGTADVLIAGLGIVLPGIFFVALHRIGELRRYDVIMQEAIKDIEGQVTRLKADWQPHPEFFSHREAQTGEAHMAG